jgi:ferredoxin
LQIPSAPSPHDELERPIKAATVPEEEKVPMRVVVDLVRCESYAQCVFLAPKVFWMKDEESLGFDYDPDDTQRLQVERAAAACPVQAIRISRSGEQPAKGARVSQ